MKTLVETIEYEHKGIKVLVHIDHLKGEVSLVEWTGLSTGFINKKWLFANRGLEYMRGWQNILDAMKYAIGEATKLLEHDLVEEKIREYVDVEWRGENIKMPRKLLNLQKETWKKWSMESKKQRKSTNKS